MLSTVNKLHEQTIQARKLIIDMAATEVGCHIGGSLSVIDVLLTSFALYGGDERNRIILSKGHAAAALYSTLYVLGWLHDNPADSYGQKDSLFTGHPNHLLPQIPFATGSLGHGTAYGAGWALSQRLRGEQGRSIVISGDGELQEGSCWEALQVIAAKQLHSFTQIIDHNGGQNDGLVQDISPLPRLADRFSAFGFDVREIDGHDLQQISAALEIRTDRPLAIIAHTIKGKGIKAMEGNPAAHYAKISRAQAYKWKEALA
ncbi:1-deoxy-D-xylulose-5-phosphate synthase N-terminal domain-containing protein [Paenibacillus campi]|uniref:1-deoxy-D-xylulose-5-phosphate synthase N-terminal domain-containing protein n=1 Tax=Paenibacillus campi TaxID=3106031 RepID=UPI002B003939|nr:1-deoxy-D-xylulose-5-phosphate synthase N-terminal domain-containing protein [Paenibacillus sp. SGZ-1014]